VTQANLLHKETYDGCAAEIADKIQPGDILYMKFRNQSCLLLIGLLALSPACRAQLPQPDGGSFQRGVLPERWATGGPKCMEMPEWQVHEFNADLYILRQSGCTDFEKPFLYLLFGRDKALLLDTGSHNGNLAPALQSTVHRWLKRNSRISIPLLVVHTHEHGDHVAGDATLQALNDPAIPITLIPAKVEANMSLYQIAHWPDDIGSVDLGDRVIDAIPIPGHSAASIALYDRKTATLFSGDTLYPGRLYIRNFPEYVASVSRLVRFTDGKPVAQILGNHIEQTRTPFLDYPEGSLYQPNEHELQLSRGSLLELQSALASEHGVPARLALRDFTIWPSPTTAEERKAEEKRFETTQKQQLSHMWDQAQP
jgi:hydroxyacylglutathione hydrolase